MKMEKLIQIIVASQEYEITVTESELLAPVL